MARIFWDTNFPMELRAVIEPYFEQFKMIVPTWCELIHVYYDRERGSATNNTQEDYRFATITFEAGFIDQPEWKRRIDVLHEMIHIVLDPIHTQLLDLKNLFAQEEEYEKYIAEQIKHSIERTTTDLTYCVDNLMKIIEERQSLPIEVSRR